MTEIRPPRPFQRNVLAAIMRGKNVILQAPTGAGKTDAALMPFIQNLGQGGNALPSTCLYATPMRVLSTQFYQKYRDRMARLDQQGGAELIRLYEALQRNPIAIQTGEQQDDPQFESLLTFCTIDQLLASFLGVPYAVDSRRANLNVAAVVGSYLVLDEFHLYPLSRDDKSCFGARTTTLSMLRHLKSITRFILMTATFSTTLLSELKELLDAEIVTLSDEELALIADGRERMFEIASSTMDAATILDKHDRCSLVICNTVLRAQQVYQQIKKRVKGRGIEVVLLHSRLTVSDRTSRSAEVIHELGQAPKQWGGEGRYGWKDGEYYGKNLIVVATQVVEVGLDISVQVLHTELAPANSLIQRAGRCARFARQKGKVIVYPLIDAEGQELSSRPYDKSLCAKTWDALRHMNPSVVGFREEQALIDAVHTEEDLSLLSRYESNQGHITKSIFNSLAEHGRGVVSSLIRDVVQVHVLIHDNPNNAITEEPWRWQSFALHPVSLVGRWQALQEKASDLQLDWGCKQAVAVPEGEADADNKQKTKYTWVEIATSDKQDRIAATLRKALMVVLPSQLATYHDELGFVLLDGRLDVSSTGYQSALLPKRAKEKSQFAALRQQCYQEHIQGLVNAYNRGIRQSIRYMVERLEQQIGIPSGSVDQAIRLALACHDLGKLGEQWQQWAWEWQMLLFERQGWPRPPSHPYFFAKTDFDFHSPDYRKWREEMKTKRPPHACESVAIGRDLIAESLCARVGEEKCEMLLRAVCGAIAHHHTADAHTYGTVKLKQEAKGAVGEALEQARQQLAWTYDLSHLYVSRIEGDDLAPTTGAPSDAYITKPRQGRLTELETWLYFVIVRALRLADQRADVFSQI